MLDIVYHAPVPSDYDGRYSEVFKYHTYLEWKSISHEPPEDMLLLVGSETQRWMVFGVYKVGAFWAYTVDGGLTPLYYVTHWMQI